MIYNANALDYLVTCPYYRCIFADVFDNIGLEYVGFKDRMEYQQYVSFIKTLLSRALTKCDIFWFTYNQVHDTWIKAAIHDLRDLPFEHKQIVWYYTFGQYQDTKLTSCYRPILCFTKQGVSLNYDGIRVTSTRMQMGDLRAAGPRVPGDVWEYARVVGNSKERRAWHPTQIPEAILFRVLILSCMVTLEGRTTKIPGARVCDLFLGSGTTAIVAKQLSIDWDGVELSKRYCQELKELLKANVIIAT
jgi:hypothetical protein